MFRYYIQRIFQYLIQFVAMTKILLFNLISDSDWSNERIERKSCVCEYVFYVVITYLSNKNDSIFIFNF